MEDREILILLRAKDEAALRALFDKYRKYCAGIASNILRDESDAEECVNDAILQVWNAPPKKDDRSLQSYLTAIVRNLAFDRRKEQNRLKRGGDVRTEALDDFFDLADSLDNVESAFEKRELARALNRFLRSLAPKERAMFIKRFYDLEDAGAIARDCGTTRWTVYKTLSRTKEKLRSFLKTEGFK